MITFLLTIILLPIAILMLIGYWYVFAALAGLALVGGVTAVLILAIWLIPGFAMFFSIVVGFFTLIWIVTQLAKRYPGLNKRIF